MEPEITFLVSYRCPRCQAILEARGGLSQGWVRCPSCGRPSLPPETMRSPAVARPSGDVLVIGPEPSDRPFGSAQVRSRSPRAVRARAAFFGAGFLLSLLLALLALLDRNPANAMAFCGLAVACPILWAVTSRRR